MNNELVIFVFSSDQLKLSCFIGSAKIQLHHCKCPIFEPPDITPPLFQTAKKLELPLFTSIPERFSNKKKNEIGIFHFISIGFSKRTRSPIFPYNFYKAKIACQKMTRTKKAVARWGSHAATALLLVIFHIRAKTNRFRHTNGASYCNVRANRGTCCHLGIIAQISFNGCIVVNNARTGAGPSVINQCFGIIPGQLIANGCAGGRRQSFRAQTNRFVYPSAGHTGSNRRPECMPRYCAELRLIWHSVADRQGAIHRNADLPQAEHTVHWGEKSAFADSRWEKAGFCFLHTEGVAERNCRLNRACQWSAMR